MEAGRKAREVSRELGVREATRYAWKSKYGGAKKRVELVGQRRDVAPVMAEHSLSERHPCKLLEVDRASYRYEPQRADDGLLRAQLIEHAKRKRLVRPAQPVSYLSKANQEWAMDLVMDSLATGRGFRAFALVDGFTCECLAIEVDSCLSGCRVTRVLEWAGAKQKIEAWRQEYNGERPHSSLNYRTPEELADWPVVVPASRHFAAGIVDTAGCSVRQGNPSSELRSTLTPVPHPEDTRHRENYLVGARRGVRGAGADTSSSSTARHRAAVSHHGLGRGAAGCGAVAPDERGRAECRWFLQGRRRGRGARRRIELLCQ